MTRIIAGVAKGARLLVPGTGTRPTSDRVREAVFSALEARDAVRGAGVLDLYAGSGALGLEAASRGAAAVVLVEKAAGAVRAIRSNVGVLRRAGADAGIEVVAGSVGSFLARDARSWDLVFVDPPYELPSDDVARVLSELATALAPDAIVVLERSARDPEPGLPATLELERRVDYGETAILWIGLAPTPS